MYKSEVKHQCDIHHGQGDSDKDYFGELPAGMFHLSVIFTERFTPPGCVAELAEQVGKKAEHHPYNKSNNPTEIAKHQRCSKRYEYGKEPAKEQQHTPVKVVMLPFVPYLGYIPHIVDEADPVFAIVLIHIITKIMYFAHLIITSYRKTPRKIKNTSPAFADGYFYPHLSLIRCDSSGSALMRSISSATICLTSFLMR